MKRQKSKCFRGMGALGLVVGLWLLGTGAAQAEPPPPPTVGAGGSHSCAVMDGGVRCWGSNDYGELGAPSFGDVKSATSVLTLEPGTNAGVTSLAVGEHHSCAIVNETLKCWGRNDHGQLGLGDTDDRRIPSTVPNLTGVKFVAAGRSHTCVVSTQGNVTNSVKCWGDNSSGQLGLGDLSGGHTSPPSVSLLGGIRSVAAGAEHTCALLLVGGQMWCWGSNSHGQLGIGEVGCDDSDCTVPNLVPNLIDFIVQISAGESHTCATTAAKGLLCWGADDKGQLGLGPNTSCDVPDATPVPSLEYGVISVSAGPNYSCAVVDNGIRCWGAGDSGQQGDATTQQAMLPHDVINLSAPANTGIPEVSAGNGHACAIYNGELYCWGGLDHGVVGDGKEGRLLSPQLVPGLNTTATVSSGREHACALSASGSVSCWGRNNFGQVGDNTTADSIGPKVIIPNGASAVATGDTHSCAIVGGNVRCWGRNQWGQLGVGNNNDAPVPETIPNLTGVTAIAAGNLHTCAIYSDANVIGGVKCWGRNTNGELGLGDYPPCIQPIDCLSPTKIPNLSGVKAISASAFYTCAVDGTNSLMCWGRNNYGQLGLGDQTNQNLPVMVPGLTGVTAVATSDGHACVVYSDGAVTGGMKCWGRNYYGELGLGDAAPCGNAFPYLCLTPTIVPGWNAVTAVAVGSYHSCLIGLYGGIACWGWGEEGQLGSRWLDDWNTPHPVDGLSGATTISAGAEHTCASFNTGTVECWGNKLYGRLGVFVSGLATVPDKVIINDVIFANRFEVKL